jgi:hypothetical protein
MEGQGRKRNRLCDLTHNEVTIADHGVLISTMSIYQTKHAGRSMSSANSRISERTAIPDKGVARSGWRNEGGERGNKALIRFRSDVPGKLNGQHKSFWTSEFTQSAQNP